MEAIMRNFCLPIFISLAVLFAPANWVWAEGGTSVSLQWSFKGKNFNWNSMFAKEDCDYYRNRPHPKVDDYSVYATDTVDDRYITDLAEQFRLWMNQLKMNDLERINFVAAFIQSLSKTTDGAATSPDGYPQYPLETLMAKGGDCEDTAILAATIFNELDHEVALISLADHMGVGVVCGHCSGEYFFEGGTEYLYLETTGPGWELGQIPPSYDSPDYKVYPLIPQPVIEFEFSYKEVESQKPQKQYEIAVMVKNSGSARADYLEITASLVGVEEGQTYSKVVSEPHFLDPEDKLTSTATLFIPKDIETRLQVAVSGDNFTTQKQDSEKLSIQ
jgi:hypothetical protein